MPLAGRDAAEVAEDGIGLYDADWGDADRALTVDQDPEVTEVAVRDGDVTSVARKPGRGAIPEGVNVLLGRGDGAERLAALHPGDPVEVAYRMRTDDGSPLPRTAVGGRGVLVEDGTPQNWDGRPNNTAAPRTAVGFSEDGGTMHVLTVDGRQAASGGVTLTELARMMKKLGAYNALNLDGGGSSTLLARKPGGTALRLENAPSDGEQREVADALALTAPKGSGRLSGFWVETALDPREAATADTVPGGHPDRVFPGLTRSLTAAPYDETYGPAQGAPRPRWRAARPDVGRVDAQGVFRARRTGSTSVTARAGAAEGTTKLRVLGPLERVRATTDRVGLADGAAADGSFGLVGYDAEGNSAPVEPADARLSYDHALFSVTADEDAADGRFTVRTRSGQESASGTVTVTVRGHTTRVAVTVGLREQQPGGRLRRRVRLDVQRGPRHRLGGSRTERQGRRRARAQLRLHPFHGHPCRLREPARRAGDPRAAAQLHPVDQRGTARVPGPRCTSRTRRAPTRCCAARWWSGGTGARSPSRSPKEWPIRSRCTASTWPRPGPPRSTRVRWCWTNWSPGRRRTSTCRRPGARTIR